MSGSNLHALQKAAELINLARGEEHPTGNPLSAARYYTAAMEVMLTVARNQAADCADPDVRRKFISFVYSRVRIYYTRACLLLDVATETGLLDKPGISGGLQAALPVGSAAHSLPPQFLHNDGAASTGGAGGSPAVMGVPLPPLSKQQQQQQSGAGSQDPGYYMKGQPDLDAPPPSDPFNLDDLMKGFQ